MISHLSHHYFPALSVKGWLSSPIHDKMNRLSRMSELDLLGQLEQTLYLAIKAQPFKSNHCPARGCSPEWSWTSLCLHLHFPFPETLTFAATHDYIDGPCAVKSSPSVSCALCLFTHRLRLCLSDWIWHPQCLSVRHKPDFEILLLVLYAVASSRVSSFFLSVAFILLIATASILNTWAWLVIPACILALYPSIVQHRTHASADLDCGLPATHFYFRASYFHAPNVLHSFFSFKLFHLPG